MMEEIKLISESFSNCFGKKVIEIFSLPRSGSDRRYFRIISDNESFIGAFNANKEENDAYVGFTAHFLKKNLHVPEVFYYLPEKHIYFIRDLGDVNLYTWLHSGRIMDHFSNETMQLYQKILDELILFQVEGIKGLDLDLCYPHRSFDRQSMMWDMNYFKYMFLKLLNIKFNEKNLEHDFIVLSDYLLSAGQDYFLYRDFQTANIMILENEPWFIDFQGGRLGAPQYDLASLLYDAKIPMSQSDRDVLRDYYISKFTVTTSTDKKKFSGYYEGFSLIRILQALGAFGFRGLYEQKPTFTESIVPGVNLLLNVVERAEQHVQLNELFSAVKIIPSCPIFKKLANNQKLIQQ